MNGLKKILLLPVTLLYGVIVFARNKCYDLGIFNSTRFTSPIISVGNLSVGGTGKTPHIEYLINLLKKEFNVAILSRGYKRNTSGFLLGNPNTSSDQIGDEPLQYLKKHPEITVAVDEKRVNGVKKLLQVKPNIDVFLLDDAYQHRAIARNINILINDFNTPYYSDWLMPSGRLREWRNESKRADIIITSKTKENLSFEEQNLILKKINPLPSQKVFFSYIKYGKPKPFNTLINNQLHKDSSILCFTGIANPKPFIEELNKSYKNVNHISFPDHHQFNNTDINKIKRLYSEISSDNKAIFTTEKDIMRLYLPELKNQLNNVPVYYVPIEVCFHNKGKEEFDRTILEYVRKNSRN